MSQVVAAVESLREAIERLSKAECRCVECPVCDGTGMVDVVSAQQRDGVDVCPHCHGTRRTEQCIRCRKLAELESRVAQAAR